MLIDKISRTLGRNGTRPVTVVVTGLGIDTESLPAAMLHTAAKHGIEQLLGDTAALTKEQLAEFYDGVSVEAGDKTLRDAVTKWITDKANDVKAGLWVPGSRASDPIEVEIRRLVRVAVGSKFRDKELRAKKFAEFRAMEGNANAEDSAALRYYQDKYRAANESALEAEAKKNIGRTAKLMDFDIDSL